MFRAAFITWHRRFRFGSIHTDHPSALFVEGIALRKQRCRVTVRSHSEQYQVKSRKRFLCRRDCRNKNLPESLFVHGGRSPGRRNSGALRQQRWLQLSGDAMHVLLWNGNS